MCVCILESGVREWLWIFKLYINPGVKNLSAKQYMHKGNQYNQMTWDIHLILLFWWIEQQAQSRPGSVGMRSCFGSGLQH